MASAHTTQNCVLTLDRTEVSALLAVINGHENFFRKDTRIEATFAIRLGQIYERLSEFENMCVEYPKVAQKS